LPASTSAFTSVSHFSVPARRSTSTTSFGRVAVDITPTPTPRPTSLTVCTRAPRVTARGVPPPTGAKYRLRVPSLSALKYTPLLSDAHISPCGVRSMVPFSTRGFEPSIPITYSFASTHVSSDASKPV
jgi:hypothetical protein